MIVERVDELERQAFWPARAEFWRGVLSVRQYVERNSRIFAHPYGKERIVTWVARDASGQILSSLDILEMKGLVYGTAVMGGLIASVFTPPSQRGHDYARTLIARILDARSGFAILNSDLRPEFYEKLGFVDVPVSDEKTLAGEKYSKRTEESVSLSVLTRLLDGYKSSRALGAFTLTYSELLLDWNVERYRYFAELAGTRLPTDLYWVGKHAMQTHPMILIPHPLEDQLDALFLDSGCQECISFAKEKAAELKLKYVHYWRHTSAGRKHPMIRVNPPLPWVDQHYIEYW